ncbi:MAG TPA: hypothetical protein VLA24_01215 [Pseudomonadales bacterium]|nr:hypothetical protein [Pseudomonadales bacterium]
MNTLWTEALNKADVSVTDSPSATDTWISPIEGFAALSVVGPDAQKFLQGQLSCDVAALNSAMAGLGSHCNPQGRMVSNFRIFSPEPQHYVLVMRDSLRDIAQKQLQKYIVFSKATLSQVEGLVAVGLHGPSASQIVAELFEISTQQQNSCVQSEHGVAIQVDQNKQSYELYLSTTHAADILVSLLGTLKACDHQHWEATLIKHGLLYIHGDQSGEHIPLVINFDQLGGINFKKGCYTGQEIIARLHYRGKAKRSLYALTAAAEFSVARGQKVLLSDDQKAIGEIVSTATTKNLTTLLAILNLSADEALPALQLENSGPSLFVL